MDDAIRVDRTRGTDGKGMPMNRRRIGLAALVVGAGVAVRQRLKTRVDAGPDVAAPSSATTPVVSLNSDPQVDSAIANAATPNSEMSTAATTDDAADMDFADARIVDLEATEAASTDDADAELAAAETTDEAAVEAAAGEATDVADEEPDVEAPVVAGATAENQDSNSDSDPAIRLPTMPPAGTRASNGQPAPATADPASMTPPAETPQAALGLQGTADVTEASSPAPRFVDAPAQPHVPPATSVGQVPPPAARQQPERQSFYRKHRGWSIGGSILLGLIVVAVIAASFIRLPYYSLQPGSVYDTIERVEAPGDLVSIPSGEIGFVTVAQTANITPWQWLDAKLDNNVNIRHEDEVRGDQTADELREADIRRMQVSKNSAVVVALQKLGFDLIITPIGIEVAQVFDCTAADGTLGTGDLIVGVNGVDVRSGEELVEQLMGQSVGTEVELLIERIDPNNPTQSIGTELVAITLGSADAACLPDDVRAEEPRPFIGIGTLPMFDEEFPIEIDVRTGAVSGPSAGLAFTLAIMDVLSEGELTNELSVVATGTIDRDGNVGPVGGIHQKTVAAERSGADVFIVPNCCDNFVSREDGEPLDIPSNYEEALLYADDMIVIGVDTLDEALIALGELGGDVDAFVDQSTS